MRTSWLYGLLASGLIGLGYCGFLEWNLRHIKRDLAVIHQYIRLMKPPPVGGCYPPGAQWEVNGERYICSDPKAAWVADDLKVEGAEK